MPGMTLKQYAIERYRKLVGLYRIARARLDTPEGRAAFVVLSVQVHAARGTVPRRCRVRL